MLSDDDKKFVADVERCGSAFPDVACTRLCRIIRELEKLNVELWREAEIFRRERDDMKAEIESAPVVHGYKLEWSEGHYRNLSGELLDTHRARLVRIERIEKVEGE